MSPIDKVFNLFFENQNEMIDAIKKAGGTTEVVLSPPFQQVLKILSQNNIDIRCAYLKEDD